MKRPLSIVCLIISFFLIVFSDFPKDYEEKYSHLNNNYTTISGTVSDIAFKLKDDSVQTIIYLKEGIICYMKTPEASNSGNPNYPHIGSNVTIKGTAFIFENATNPGQFDQRNYYAIMDIHYGMYNCVLKSESSSYSHFKNYLFNIRKKASDKLDSLLPPVEASIMKTMLLGEKSQMDSELKALYQRNGIAHILAISGLHISLLGIGLFKLLRKMNMHIKNAAFLSSILVILYGLLTGFSVSGLRAIFMFCFAMTGTIIGRAYDLVTGWSVSFLSIMLINPLYIHHSGFIFSFCCIIGIFYLIPAMCTEASFSQHFSPFAEKSLPKIQRFYRLYLAPHGYKPSPIFNKLLTGGSMTLIGMPIYFYYYYQMPIYSMFLNFLVIPVMSILVTAGFFLLTISYISILLSLPFRYVIIGILKIFEFMAEFFETLPFHFYTPGAPSLLQCIIYTLILSVVIIFKDKLKLCIKWCIAILAILILLLRIRPPLEITMLDVGQGESIFIRNNENSICIPGLTRDYSILVDGGSTSVKEVGKYRIIPFLKYQGASSLDLIVITHPDKDHVNGILELIDTAKSEGLKLKRIALPDISPSSQDKSYKEIEKKCMEHGLEIIYLSRGDIISSKNIVLNQKESQIYTTKDKSSQNVLTIKCLSPTSGFNPQDINEASIVLLASYQNIDMLLTGDIQGNAEKNCISYLAKLNTEKIEILKVSHHGSKNSTPSDLLNTIHPSISLISSGKDNSYGHPHKETLDRLAKYAPNGQILRTDEQGAISLEWWPPGTGLGVHLKHFTKSS